MSSDGELLERVLTSLINDEDPNLNWDESLELFGFARIDPSGCGCTDCIIGESKPESSATEFEIKLAERGLVMDAR